MSNSCMLKNRSELTEYYFMLYWTIFKHTPFKIQQLFSVINIKYAEGFMCIFI